VIRKTPKEEKCLELVGMKESGLGVGEPLFYSGKGRKDVRVGVGFSSGWRKRNRTSWTTSFIFVLFFLSLFSFLIFP
jgi:hypothetical protein